jgi:hypothetical protein
MTRTDMPRHQKRVRNVIATHSTTLIPLFDSVHWFLVVVNTDTRTFTFYKSYGKHGQQKWSPTLKAWLTHHIHGPWTAAQGIATQQPGTTECGTYTLLNIIEHIPGAPSPDTSTIQWSHHMRIHIINIITASGHTTATNAAYTKTHPTSYSYNRARNTSAQATASQTQGSIPQRAQTKHHQRKSNHTGQVPSPLPPAFPSYSQHYTHHTPRSPQRKA